MWPLLGGGHYGKVVKVVVIKGSTAGQVIKKD